MKITITGVTGFVGKLLYSSLIQAFDEVSLISRNKAKLMKEYPNADCFDYTELSSALKETDIVLHLAAINSNSNLPEKEFNKINADLLLKIAKSAKKENVKRFINITSFHILDDKNQTYYANSKRRGIAMLTSMNWPAIENVYLPAVYGNSWSGDLSPLNLFPLALSKTLFAAISAFKPTLNIKLLIEYVLNPPGETRMNNNRILLYDDKSKNLFYSILKRILDLTFVLFISVFFSWLMILVWVCIRSTSKGPGLFVQTRLGKDQKPFKCYKFRTMYDGTLDVGTHEAAASSITPIGQFLRKTKIDELPQIINIVRNELSLVGPRPCLPHQVEVKNQRAVFGAFKVKPGITGFSQINNIDMSTPTKLAEYDFLYIAQRGLLYDIKIIIATALGNGQGDKVKK